MTREEENELMAVHDRAACRMTICRELQTAAIEVNRVPRASVHDAMSAATALESVLARLRGWEDDAEAEMMEMRRRLGRSPGASGGGR